MATRPQFRDEAFVIRSYKLGESDLIVVLLTREHGVVRVVAKGVRKSSSRFGAHVDRFSKINVNIYPGRSASFTSSAGGTRSLGSLSSAGGAGTTGATSAGLGKLTDASTVAHYASGIIASPEHYSAACAVLEVALALSTHEEDMAHTLFPLVDNTFAELAQGGTAQSTQSPQGIQNAQGTQVTQHGTTQHTQNTQNNTHTLPASAHADRFVLHALNAAGWSPRLAECAHCGSAGPHRAFHIPTGGAVCLRCRPPGSLTPESESVHLLWSLHNHRLANAQRILSSDSTGAVAYGAHELLAAYARFVLESALPAYSSLAYYAR